MISYAQNGEDVVLARLFGGQATGRYVDIGAGYPLESSVTKHFYDLGWRGVNVEPDPPVLADLRAARPLDVNLGVAVGATAGRSVLYTFADQWGRSTIDTEVVATYREEQDWDERGVDVEVVTLSGLLDAYPGPVDFLKVDVEGAEHDVLAGGDWRRHRPRVVVVEATVPGTATPSHQAWEPILVEAGYACALFDGLNRFYATADDTEALRTLASPANILDGFETYEISRLRETIREEHTLRAAESGYNRRLADALEEALARIRDLEEHQRHANSR